MSTTTISSREFNQNTSEAKKAASKGPVIITDRGQPSHVLLAIDEYRRLTGQTAKLSDLLSMPDCEAAEVEFERLPDLARAADLE
jgi:prevent-host-death family protein